MKTIKNLIFAKNSPALKFSDNRELKLSVYFLAACVAFVLTSLIFGI